MLEAFLLSKKAWIEEEKKQDNSQYWIDFPLVSCCKYAFKNGVEITVESDYIPKWLYEKTH